MRMEHSYFFLGEELARLDEITSFVDIVEAGSLSAASRRSGLALSAVSRRLKDLEARLGTTLLQRTTRTQRLTEEGQAFYQRCRQILDDLDAAEALMTDRTGQLTGRIRMTAPASFAVHHLSDVITDFLQANSEISIDLDLSDRRIDLLEEGFDLAIRIGSLEDSTLIAKRLTRIRHVPCASPSLLQVLGYPDHPEDLADFPALTYRSRAGRARWRFRRPDGSRGAVTPSARLWVSNGDMLCKQAVSGLGVILEPTFIAAPYLLDGRLVPLFVDHAWSEDAAFAVYPRAEALPQRVRAIIDHVADALTMDPPWDRQLRKVLNEVDWDTH